MPVLQGFVLPLITCLTLHCAAASAEALKQLSVSGPPTETAYS
ncbi:hypothetical protein [Uliginosibacterium sp. TH139]|nr:hypothetical protein [Uliginosibacterium sp. TH139]